MIDLQTEWRPTTFSWKRALHHAIPSDGWCCCMGAQCSPDPSLGLCPCKWTDSGRGWPVQVMVLGDAYAPFPDEPRNQHVEFMQLSAA